MKKLICPYCGEELTEDMKVAEMCFSCGESFEGLDINDKTLEKIFHNQSEDVKRSIQNKVEVQKQREVTKKMLGEKEKYIKSINDIYEYDVVVMTDLMDGSLDSIKLKNILRKHAEEGWRLVNTMTNELGKNSNVTGLGGYSTGTNATINETILIFERCIKRNI